MKPVSSPCKNCPQLKADKNKCSPVCEKRLAYLLGCDPDLFEYYIISEVKNVNTTPEISGRLHVKRNRDLPLDTL